MGGRALQPGSTRRAALAAALLTVACTGGAASASAQETPAAAIGMEEAATSAAGGNDAAPAASPGATLAPGNPRIGALQCLSRCLGPITGIIHSRVRITGSELDNVVLVSFPGVGGKRVRDRSPVLKPSGALLAKVPEGATSGPIRIADSFGQFQDSTVTFGVGTKAQLRAARQGYIFPVRGPHSFGGAESRFGAPRDGHVHQGQDVSAACGTILAVVHSGIVKASAYQATGAGHYVVIDGADVKQDYVYMHLKGPSPLALGQAVTTGQKVGKVGNTGHSFGCHLHFEIWVGAGWYSGGGPIDPLPLLQYWDGYS